MGVDEIQHRKIVRSQWRTVERLERRSDISALGRHAARFRGQYRHAVAQLPQLKPWPKLPERSLRVYSSRSDMARVWRVCQFLSSEDRILDIGMGHGWLPGILARAVRPQSYAGIDLTDSRFESVREMAEVNGIDASGWFLGVKNLYDLTSDWVSDHDPTIVLLLEVLEHLPDPQGALQTIADSIPPETELLFSVPMLGRVESCWGHVSLFDAKRVRRLCENAGLNVHWVEPVADTWQLLLVSRASTRPARLSPLVEDQRPAPVPAPGSDGDDPTPILAPDGDPTFHQVSLRPMAAPASEWTTQVDEHSVTHLPTGGVRLEANASGGSHGSTPSVGVAFAVGGLRVIRIELAVPERRGVSRLIVEGRDSQGRRTVRWDLAPSWRWRLPSHDTTYVLRPGRATGGFKPVTESAASTTRVVEIVVQLKPRSTASLVLRRAAYVR
jgi:2-polyprenyl-3-methyl-5-hydroxy-6-metoxy-1,4-benzoquinol methylase